MNESVALTEDECCLLGHELALFLGTCKGTGIHW